MSDEPRYSPTAKWLAAVQAEPTKLFPLLEAWQDTAWVMLEAVTFNTAILENGVLRLPPRASAEAGDIFQLTNCIALWCDQGELTRIDPHPLWRAVRLIHLAAEKRGRTIPRAELAVELALTAIHRIRVAINATPRSVKLTGAVGFGAVPIAQDTADVPEAAANEQVVTPWVKRSEWTHPEPPKDGSVWELSPVFTGNLKTFAAAIDMDEETVKKLPTYWFVKEHARKYEVYTHKSKVNYIKQKLKHDETRRNPIEGDDIASRT